MEWQPIETAPKDGSAFLGAFTEWPCMLICWWDHHPRCNCWIAGGYMRKQENRIPTHWMPLPEPPDRRKMQQAKP